MKKKQIFLLVIIFISIIFIIPSIIYYKKNQANINEIPVIDKEIVTIEESKENINIELAQDIDLEKAREKYNNSDIVARLEIPDLFNILVVQGKDNNYYLNHSLYKKSDKKGTEYLDYRTNTESKQINIYGHNSRTYDIPFRKLEKFLKKDFFDQHEYIVLQTENQKRIYQIFSIKEYNNNYEYMKINITGKDFLKHIETLKENSINEREVQYDEKSNLIILQTCKYGEEKTYYIISAIEIKNYTN